MPTVNLTELRNFIPPAQLAVIRSMVSGEEGVHFAAKLAEFSERVRSMHRVYQQSGRGQDAIAHLHYFKGGCDWYITERDTSSEQLQAFGMASMQGDRPELGYISVAELIAHGAELDLYFQPAALKDLKQQGVVA